MHSFFPLDPMEEGLVLGSSPPPVWTVSPGMAFGIREQILLALHFSHPTQQFSTLICLIKSALFSKKKKRRRFVGTLCVKMYHRPDQMTLRVLRICNTAQCKLVNTFVFVFIFSNQGFV